ncbi:MAG: solute carrier family 23 protein, partial [Oscillospiraceae bacterium]
MSSLKLRDYLLSIQHLFAMFGATVLVPLLTGVNPAVALVAAGVGTLIFHVCTKFQVPVFLGSSFAFIAPICTVMANHSTKAEGVRYVQGGIIIAGCVYLLFSLIAYLVGPDRIKKVFPPVVTGPVIVVIGIGLSYVAINDALGLARVFTSNGESISSSMTVNGTSVLISLFVVMVVVGVSMFTKGFFRLIPILIGMAAGYVLCMILDACGVISVMD